MFSLLDMTPEIWIFRQVRVNLQITLCEAANMYLY
jgi:hypothetical protein